MQCSWGRACGVRWLCGGRRWVVRSGAGNALLVICVGLLNAAGMCLASGVCSVVWVGRVCGQCGLGVCDVVRKSVRTESESAR